MKRVTVLFICLLISLYGVTACAQVERCAVLDNAFSMLEEGNLFLCRYNELTGAEVEPWFPLGVPYFYGGVKKEWLFAKYPDYMTRECWQTTKYYEKDKVYIMGWDCAGFTRWVWTESGLESHASIASLLADDVHDRHLLCQDTLLVPDWDELHQYLQPGDLMAMRHPDGGHHIMMYIGTLADYAFTADEVPSLAGYLDWPLVIHCSTNPAFGPRFQQFIDQTGGKYNRCITTDGGVCVALLGPGLDDAEHHETVQKQDQGWFVMDGGRLLLCVEYVDDAPAWCWYR